MSILLGNRPGLSTMCDVSDELRIVVVGAATLPAASHAALEKAASDYGARLLEDATRIERARRLDPGPPMITDTAIALADLNARNGELRRPRSGRQQVLSVIAYAAAFASGGFAGYIAKPVGAIGFAICAVLGVLAYVGNRND